MSITKYEEIKIRTKNNEILWKNIHGIATEDTANIMDKAMLNWLTELTNTLEIWINKGLNLTTGELILARTNLGSIVEFWLRHFYTAYYEDYQNNPITNKNNVAKNAQKDASFDELKKFSTGILWKDDTDPMYKWVNSIQHKRNAIHSFLYKEIGTPTEFLNDVDFLLDFIKKIENQLPSILDCIDVIPSGYEDIDGLFYNI